MQLSNTRKSLVFTRHARAKMAFYKLSESRVRHVLYAPKRIEEGVAPKTIAMMYPARSHEIWVMLQNSLKEQKIISAWRYPGVTKPRSAVAMKLMQQEYEEFIAKNK